MLFIAACNGTGTGATDAMGATVVSGEEREKGEYVAHNETFGVSYAMS